MNDNGKEWGFRVLIAALSSLIFALMVSGIVAFLRSAMPEAEAAAPPRLTLPQKCAHLRVEPNPENWNPVTETYEAPEYDAWFDCMGVGRR